MEVTTNAAGETLYSIEATVGNIPPEVWVLLLVILTIMVGLCLLIEKLLLRRWSKRPRPSILGIIGRSLHHMFYAQAILWIINAAASFLIEDKYPKAYQYIDNADDGVNLFLLVIISARLVKECLRYFGLREDNQQASLEGNSLLMHIVDISIYTCGILLIMQYFGVAVTTAVTALGVGGLAIGLALKDTLANLFAGIYMLVAQNVRIGDIVRLASGEKGTVTNISWRQTTLRDANNNSVIFPNEKMAGSIIINYCWPDKNARLEVYIVIDGEQDLAVVEQGLNDDIATLAANQPELTMHEWQINYKEFVEDGVKLKITIKTNDYGKENEILHEIIKTVNAWCLRNGVRMKTKNYCIKQ